MEVSFFSELKTLSRAQNYRICNYSAQIIECSKKHQKTMFSLNLKFILKNFQEVNTKSKIQQKSSNSIIFTNGGSKMAFRS